MKRLVRLLLCFSLFCAFIFCMPVSADDSLTLRVGIYENSPKIFTDENGDAAGFWPEIIAYIASEEGWQIDYVPGTWAECLERLENNEIDVMPDVAYTEERAELYDFSAETVYVSWSTVYTREGADIESIPDLEGKTVAVMRGSVNYEGPGGIKTLASNFGVSCTFLEVNSYTEVFELVSSGEADAGVTSKDFGHLYAADFNLAETPIIFQPSSLYFAFPKDASLTPYLIETIDSRVAELKADEDSVYYQALTSWFGIKPAGEPIIPDWMKWALIGVGGLALLLFGGGLLLRSQVRARTKELREEVSQRKKAEEASRESELKYHSLFDNSKDAVLLTIPDGRILAANPEACRMFGRTEEEICRIGRNGVMDLSDPRLEPALKQREATGEFSGELTCIRADGTRFPVDLSSKVFFDKDSQARTCMIIHDITNRKQAEERERHLNLVLKALRDINQLITREKDREHLIQKGCQILVDTRGYERAWILLVDKDRHFVSAASAGAGEQLPVLMKEMKRGKYPPCVGRVLGQEQPLVTYEDVSNQCQGCRLVESHRQRSAFMGRLEYDGKTYGMITVSVSLGLSSDREEQKLFRELVGDISFALAGIEKEEERRRAEAALEKSEERFRMLVEGVKDYAIFMLDPDGNVVSWNKGAETIKGYEAKEIIGQHFSRFYIDEDIKSGKPLAELQAAREEGRFEDEGWRVRKDGSRFWANVGITALWDEDGNLRGFSKVTRDITERKQAEEALKESEERFRSVVENSQVGIMVLDNGYRFTYVNDELCRITGYSRKEAVGQDFRQFLDGESKQLVADRYLRRQRGEKVPPRYEFNFVRKDGQKRHMEISSAVIEDSTGAIKTVAQVLDVTERKQAEEALRESEARYRAVVEGAHDMIQSISFDGRIIFVNKAWRDTLGYTEAELSSLNLFDIIHPDSLPHCQKLFKEVMGGKSVHGIEAAFLAKDGRKILLEGNAAPRYIGKKVVATQGIFRDVTERKQAEEALQAEKNKLQSIISAIEYGISIQDENYSILFQSQPSRIDGLYHPGEQCYRAYEGRDKVCDNCPMAKAFKDGKSHTSERKVVSSSGEVLFLENMAIPMRDDKGKIISCLEVIRDITERKRVEEELVLRAQMLDSATDAIFVHDLDENFVYVNEATCRLYGYSREELLKMKLSQLVPPEQANGLATLKQETLGKGEMVFETVNLRKDGSTVPLEVHSRTIESGGEKFILAIARDITERKQMEETLVITDRLASVGELASGIAHELNNPLTGVIGFSQLVLDKSIPDDIREDLDMVYSEAQRAAQVVKNLLIFARKHAPEKQMLNINRVIEKVLELRAYEQRVNNIRVDNHLDPDLPEAMADYFQLQQVFLNIIINAEFFMKEAHNGGTLTLTTEKVGDNVRASFADDGPGIAAKNLGHLFDPFFTTKEVGKGTGLGLSICHGIVTEHGGKIYAESKPGEGATFIVELPIGGRRRGGRNEKH